MEHLGALAGISGIFLLACLSPGPSFVVISSTAIAVSRRAAILIGLGVAASTMTWAVAVMCGLGLLLAQAAWLYSAVKIAGAVYLVWLGIRMMVSAWKGQPPQANKPIMAMTAQHYFRKGYLLSVSNPTAAVFFGSVFSAMLPVAAPSWIYAASVVMVTLLSILWHCGIAVVFGIQPIQIAYRSMKRGIDAAAGAILVLLGLRLAVSR
jgi:threonine/homoserine/homoserine lactone efflux protein